MPLKIMLTVIVFITFGILITALIEMQRAHDANPTSRPATVSGPVSWGRVDGSSVHLDSCCDIGADGQMMRCWKPRKNMCWAADAGNNGR